MNKKKAMQQERIRLLYEIDDLTKGCEGCKIHHEFNKTKNITGLTNACKECPLGQRIGQYGNRLLELTKKSRKINHTKAK
ncbi:zinc-finger domain-containing protein [Brevibacillus laterosporus]|uniref:zinc-finger domain-containing protein n=1 Tax=Brevibacillus laterosporus TaxID=1465 RepID=UPI00215C6311|nr:zinc-finger domain-containing protein [Brevibacillus laterosporus]MCR8994727.1 zinc-finger domain-containing protein [Brevibacillus laterosporus]